MLVEVFALFQAVAILFLILSIERPQKLAYPLLAMVFFTLCAFASADITKAFCEMDYDAANNVWNYYCLEFVTDNAYLIYINGIFAVAMLVFVFLSYFEVMPYG